MMSSVKYSKDCADLSRAEATIAEHSEGQLQNVESGTTKETP